MPKFENSGNASREVEVLGDWPLRLLGAGVRTWDTTAVPVPPPGITKTLVPAGAPPWAWQGRGGGRLASGAEIDVSACACVYRCWIFSQGRAGSCLKTWVKDLYDPRRSTLYMV